MKKYNIVASIVIFFASLFLFQFCSSDSGTDPDGGGFNPPTSNYGIVLGTISNVNGSGLGNVTITGGGKTAISNDQGWFNMADVPATERLQLTFSLDGYVSTQKIVDVIVGETSHIDVVLAARAANQPLNGSTGGQVNTGGATVLFPPNSFSGDGVVYANYFDPTSANYNEVFPGSFEGIPSGGGSAVALESYGFMDIELKNASGADIALTGQATITMPIPGSLQATAPQTIPLWYYDTNAGYWKEEGSAEKVGNTYVGTVSHFTSWNLDVMYDVAYISGRVIDENGDPIRGARVSADGVDYSGESYRYTDSNGEFNMGVRPNSTVRVKASKSGVTSTPMTIQTPAANQTLPIGDIILAPPVVTITLSWGAVPSDLDSHLEIPAYGSNSSGHVYFSTKGSASSYPYANLDTDDTSSYGPEVVTIFRKLEGTYTYFIHNWSGESSGPLTESGAKVQLIAGGSLYNFNVPTSGNSDNLNSWHVFDLVVNSEGGIQVVSINEFKDRNEILSTQALSKLAVDKK